MAKGRMKRVKISNNIFLGCSVAIKVLRGFVLFFIPLFNCSPLLFIKFIPSKNRIVNRANIPDHFVPMANPIQMPVAANR